MQPRLALVHSLLLLATACTPMTGAAHPEPYRDATLPVETRVDDLLRRMTEQEKLAQLNCIWPRASEKERLGKGILDASGRLDVARAQKLLAHGIGHVARPAEGKDVADSIAFANEIQRFLIEHTRLGIPALFHGEGLHGHMAAGATSFPQALALSCSWDEDLVERVFTAVAAEMRARGIHQALTPVLDLCRDPRWGRTEETYGEDPLLTARLGVACIRGLQGRGARDHDYLADGRVLATAKHFAAHGQPEGGTNCAPVDISQHRLHTVYLPPFAAAVREARVRSVMAAYHEIGGVPLHAHRALLTDTLRDSFGFEGCVVSDYYGIEQLITLHHVAATPLDAAVLALEAGVDIELPSGFAFPHLGTALRAGRVSRERIDAAVRRVLRAKFEAGCFDRPLGRASRAAALVQCRAHSDLAREAARRSIVLLSNRDATLPLEPRRLKRIAVLGPNADRALLGGYTDPRGPGRVVTVLAGLRAFLQGQSAAVEVVHEEGCRITATGDWHHDEVALAPPGDDDARIERAVAAARGADVSVLVLGGNDATCREGWSEKHLGDRSSLALLGRQEELFTRVHALGKPVVVVLLAGRPLASERIAQHAHAVLAGFYLGQQGGTALAEVLFGAVVPSGRLSVTFPRSVGQLPAHYGQKPSARRGYLFADKAPLYPFGHGLSYTVFDYGAPSLDRARIRAGEDAVLTVRVTNIGARAGIETVQVYLRDLVSSVTRPVLELCGFQRVDLQPGQHRDVRITVSPHSMAVPDGGPLRVEPGDFELRVGPSSAKLQTVRLHVVGG